MKVKPGSKDVLWVATGAALLFVCILVMLHFHKDQDPAAQLAFKARRVDLVGRMQLDLASASESEKSAVLAITDQDSQTFADQARAEFEQQFSKKDYSDVSAKLAVQAGEIWIVELIEKTGKFKSRSDVRRVIYGGGVTIDGQKITDDKARVTVRDGQVLKAGKLVVVKLVVA